MVCTPFSQNETLYRSCHSLHFDKDKNLPKFSAFLPRKIDGDQISVQCQCERQKKDVINYFCDIFSNHVGYFTFTVDDCISKNIVCCDDTNPPNKYHARVLFSNEDQKRIYTAKVLLAISKYESYI